MRQCIIAFVIGCLLLAAVPLGGAAASETGLVEGTVSRSGRPVVGATVEAAGQTTRTDSKGVFRLDPVSVVGAERLIEVVVRAQGLGIWRLADARVVPNDTLQITARLQVRDVHITQPRPRAALPSSGPNWQATTAGPSPTTLAASASSAPPSTIRVYVTGDANCNTSAAGSVEVVDFRYYVKHVLPNEWRPGWPTESLRAGAMAVKSYAWYQVNRGGKWPGLGADVMDSTCDQVYNPAVSYASTSKAVDATWGYSAIRNGRVHVCYYRAGSQGDGSDPGNDIMYQWGSEYWARQGKSWSWILSYYYDNIVISQGRMSLVINKGATFSPVYKVKITSTAPPGTTRIRLSNSGATTSGLLSKGATYAYANPISWNLSSVAYGGSQANGKRTVYAQLRNSQGAWSAVMSDTILLDTARPRIESMSVGFLERSVVSASSIAVRARWTGVDATSGVVRYQVQQSTDGGRYVWATAGTTVSGYTVRAPVGTTYRFRVRALDRVGRWSVWTYTSSFAASRYQEDSSTVKYPDGAWTRDDSEQASGGYWKFSNSANAEVVFRFKGSAASWVGVRGPQYGKVDVWVDGASAGVRDLYAPTLQSRAVILSRSWKEVGSHVVRLKARDTADRPRVLVDAFGVLR